ncbi:MAG: hypothetical protein AB7D57_05760 [Desulfovibrionaceae bacterium]
MDHTSDMALLLANMTAPALFLLFGLSGLGGLLFAALSQTVAVTQGRAFCEKLARQMTAMGFTLTALFLGGGAVMVAVLAAKVPWFAEWITRPDCWVFALAALAALILAGVARFSWTALHQRRGLRLTLGLAAGLAALAAVLLLAPTARSYAAAYLTNGAARIDPATLFRPGPAALLWPVAASILFLAVSDAGAVGLLYLVQRRLKDDYGRDYYNYALPRAAWWGLAGVAPLLACQGMVWLRLSENLRAVVTQTVLGVQWLAAGVAWLLCLGAWLLLARSKAPLRLKWLALAGLVLTWAGHALLMTVLAILTSLT